MKDFREQTKIITDGKFTWWNSDGLRGRRRPRRDCGRRGVGARLVQHLVASCSAVDPERHFRSPRGTFGLVSE